MLYPLFEQYEKPSGTLVKAEPFLAVAPEQ